MQIPKDQILSLLQGQGDDAKAQQAQSELPETVETDKHAGLLSKLGISPAELIAKLSGGSDGGGNRGGLAGGIADKLGL